MTTMDKFKDDMAKEFFGITRSEAIAKGICVSCKKTACNTSVVGQKEYRISGLCESCQDIIFKEP